MKNFVRNSIACTLNILFLFSLSANSERFKEDLMNIARTTLSSKILSQHKEHFTKLAVDAVLRLKGSGDLSAIQIIKKTGSCLDDSFLDEGKHLQFVTDEIFICLDFNDLTLHKFYFRFFAGQKSGAASAPQN